MEQKIKIGDSVKVIDDSLGYDNNIGIVVGFEDPNKEDGFTVRVEFPTIPRAGLMPVFTEYFEPGELSVQ